MKFYYKIPNANLLPKTDKLLLTENAYYGFHDKEITHNILLKDDAAVAEIIPISMEDDEGLTSANPNTVFGKGYVSKEKTSSAKFLKISECGNQPKIDLDFILPGLPRKCVGTLVSPGGTGKSLAILQTAANCVLGKMGILNQSGRKRTVAYISLEDPEEVLNNRMHDLFHVLNPNSMQSSLLDANLLACSTQLSVAPTKNEITPETVTELFVGVKPDLIILDTARRAHQLEENSTGEMSLFISSLETIARTLNCAIVILHHTSKGAAFAAGKGEDVGNAASRGSTVLVDNARAVWSLQTMNDKDAEANKVLSSDRKGYIKIEQTKCNYQKAMPVQWLKRSGNGFFKDAQFTKSAQVVFDGRREKSKYAR